jgi:hypothetical protein
MYNVFKERTVLFKSTVKMKVVCSSEKLIFTEKTARHHNPDVCDLETHTAVQTALLYFIQL